MDSGFIPSSNKLGSAPPTEVGIRALRSGRQIGRETDLTKVFRLSTRMAVNCSGKHDLAAMAESDAPNGPADGAEGLRNVARGVPIIIRSIEGELDRLYGEVNRRRERTATASRPKGPPPLASNLSQDLASEASEPLQLRTSADDLLMLASRVQEPANTLATQVGTPSRSHSPYNLCADDAFVNMASVDGQPKLGQAASFRVSPSGYFTPGQLRLQLPGLASAMLAAGSTALSAKTDLWSRLEFVSAH